MKIETVTGIVLRALFPKKYSCVVLCLPPVQLHKMEINEFLLPSPSYGQNFYLESRHFYFSISHNL